MRDVENEPKVRDVSAEQRKCRFGEETEEAGVDLFPRYSYSVCNIQCRITAHLHICNCTHHLMPKKITIDQKGQPFYPECNLTGIVCLSENYQKLAILRTKWSSKDGLICDCLPSCTEQEIIIVKDEKTVVSNKFAKVEFILEHLSTEKLKRNVVRSKVDLVGRYFIRSCLLEIRMCLYHFTAVRIFSVFL